MNYLVAAIRKLKPNAEFTFENDDYSTIIWHQIEGDEPTKTEVMDAIKTVKEEEKQAELQTMAKKAAAEAKLAALGLDADDLRALGLG